MYQKNCLKMQSERKNLSEDHIWNIFDKLKQNLLQNNSINVGNLQCLGGNFQFILNYAKDAFKILVENIQNQKQTINRLKNIILSSGLGHLMPSQTNEHQDTLNLQTLNEKITQFLREKGQVLANRGTHQVRNIPVMGSQRMIGNFGTKQSRKDIKIKMKQDYGLALKFVHFHLKQQLEYDYSKKVEIPKVYFLNAFVKWCKQNNHKLTYEYLKVIQMILTNEIKKHFPNLNQTSKCFRGIKFKDQSTNYVGFGDLKSQFNGEEDSQSPPLPTFDDDNLAEDYP